MNILKEIEYRERLQDEIAEAKNPWQGEDIGLTEWEKGYVMGLRAALEIFYGKE